MTLREQTKGLIARVRMNGSILRRATEPPTSDLMQPRESIRIAAEDGMALADLLTQALKELEASEARYETILSSISKEPPCMYGTNERVYIMSLIESARLRSSVALDKGKGQE